MSDAAQAGASRPIPPKLALLKLGEIAGDAYKD